MISLVLKLSMIKLEKSVDRLNTHKDIRVRLLRVFTIICEFEESYVIKITVGSEDMQFN